MIINFWSVIWNVICLYKKENKREEFVKRGGSWGIVGV